MTEWTTVPRIVTLVGLSVLGCASTLSDRASQIRWVDAPQQIAGCESVGMVEGSSSQSGPANISTGRKNARNEALERAAAKGASMCTGWRTMRDGVAFTWSPRRLIAAATSDRPSSRTPATKVTAAVIPPSAEPTSRPRRRRRAQRNTHQATPTRARTPSLRRRRRRHRRWCRPAPASLCRRPGWR